MSVAGPKRKIQVRSPIPKKARTLASMRKPAARKKARKRKKQDPGNKAWNPRSRRQNSRHGSIAALNGILLPETDEAIIVSDRTTSYKGSITVRDPQIHSMSSPHKGAMTSKIRRRIDGRLRTLYLAHAIKTHAGNFGIYVPEDSTESVRCELPSFEKDQVKSVVSEMGLPKTNGERRYSIIDTPITKETLQAIRRTKATRIKAREPSNAEVTHHVSANDLAEKLGLEFKDAQWLHLLGHALVGDDAQIWENLVLGRAGPNAIMNDIAESLVETILKPLDGPKTVYLSAHVSFVENAEDAKLAKKITWVLKDGPGQDYTRIVKYDFDPLASAKISKTTIDEFKKLLPTLFNKGREATELKTPTKPKKPADSMSPTPAKSGSRLNIASTPPHDHRRPPRCRELLSPQRQPDFGSPRAIIPYADAKARRASSDVDFENEFADLPASPQAKTQPNR